MRDKFVIPILLENSAISALESIGRSIIQSQGNALDHLAKVKSIINGSEGITLSEAYDKYVTWLNKTSGLRPASIQKYTEATGNAITIIGKDKAVATLSKEDAAHLRDTLKVNKKSATTIDNIFSTFRGFLRWLDKEGMISGRFVVDNFLIDLPPVRKENTVIVPPSLADVAMNIVPEWSLIPRIQRYTGMRIGEVEACLTSYLGCGVVEHEGMKCFKITKTLCKTHEDRLVPVCDKLKPHLIEKAIKQTALLCAKTDKHGRRPESPAQKKYNRAVKKIKGCEKVKVHSWRVYAQTMMIEAGIDDLIVKRIIGHKDSSNVHYGYTAGRLEAMKAALDKIP